MNIQTKLAIISNLLALFIDHSALADSVLYQSKFEKISAIYAEIKGDEVDWQSLPSTYYAGRCYNGAEHRDNAMGSILAIDETSVDDATEGPKKVKYFNAILTRQYEETYFDNVNSELVEQFYRKEIVELSLPYEWEFTKRKELFSAVARSINKRGIVSQLKKYGNVYYSAILHPVSGVEDSLRIGLVCVYFKDLEI